jgi:hypothetical protein
MVNWNSTGRLLTTFVDLGFQLGKLLDSAHAMVLALGLMQIGDGVRDAGGVSLRSGMTLLRAEQACLSTRGTRSWWLLQHPGPGQGALPPVALPPL